MTELKTDQYNLHFEVINLTPPWIEAPDTIIFHHGVGANWQCWLGWVAQLQDRYRLLAFDMPGHGQSYPGDAAITIADITAICAFGIGRVARIRIPDEMTNLTAWHERISARPSVIATGPKPK